MFIFCLLATVSGYAAEKTDYRKLAEQYAPVIYQEAHSLKLDQVTRFDYDGDWNGANNWANAYLVPTPGYVYYAVMESERHFFLYYAFYHTRDYTSRVLEAYAPKIEHENDMEGMVLVVPKNGKKNARPIYMETLAHDRFYKYLPEGNSTISPRQGKIDGRIAWDDNGRDPSQSWHPSLFIESEGHGVFNLKDKYTGQADQFPGFIYRFTGRGAEEPEDLGDTDISYELLPIHEQLWARRTEIGRDKTYCCAEGFELNGNRTARFGAAFNGPIGGCAAKPPWGWDQKDDGNVRTGDWFLNPLYALNEHVNIPDFGREYKYNPYYLGPADTSEAEGCQDTSTDSRSIRQSTVETVMGIGQVLLSGGLKQKPIGDKARGMFLKNMEFLEWSSQPAMSRWQFLDASSKPIFEAKAEEGRVYRTRLEVKSSAILNSPIFNAPARYYQELVFRYRIDQPLQFSLVWQTGSQDSIPAPKTNPTYALSTGNEWKIFRLRLTDLANWQPSQETTRLQLQFKTIQNPVFLELQYIVMDRTSLAETFRKE